MAINIQVVPIDSVTQDPQNARTHPETQLEALAESLNRFGQQKPLIVSKNGIIIAGNGTHAAAKLLGWQNITVAVSTLSLEEARAYGIADNAIAEKSEWDFEELSKHIKNMSEWNPLQNWKSLGFDADIVAAIAETKEEEPKTNALLDYLSGKNEQPTKEKPETAKPIKLTADQRGLINQAINILRLQEDDFSMSEGRAVELICADYIGGAAANLAEE